MDMYISMDNFSFCLNDECCNGSVCGHSIASRGRSARSSSNGPFNCSVLWRSIASWGLRNVLLETAVCAMIYIYIYIYI